MNPDGDDMTLVRPVAAATNAFGFRLFAELLAGVGDSNVFIAPASIANALMLVHNGSSGATREALAAALGLGGFSLGQVNRASAAAWAGLGGSDAAARLTVANALWAQTGFAVNTEFLARIAAHYDATVRQLDFARPDAAESINAWVREQTRGAIARIVGPGELTVRTRLVLANAAAFKGCWATPFDLALTVPGPFTLGDGRRKQLSLMTREGLFRYAEHDAAQAIRLPYGGGRIVLDIILPRFSPTGAAAFGRRLTAEAWDAWLAGVEEREGTITLPRCRATYGADLARALAALGLGAAFGSGADFSGIGEPDLWLSAVSHGAMLDVDEVGTEAAAVTGMVVAGAVRAPMDRFTMRVDRPFYCAIRDTSSGMVLFLGFIADPEERRPDVH